MPSAKNSVRWWETVADRLPAQAGGQALGFFQSALERVLVFASEVHHLVHLGLGHFIREDAAHTHAALMHMQHHACCLFHVHREETLQDDDHKLHRSVIVIQHQNFVLAGLFGASLGFGGDADFIVGIRIVILIIGRARGCKTIQHSDERRVQAYLSRAFLGAEARNIRVSDQHVALQYRDSLHNRKMEMES